jgi:hypothetical protein
MACITCFKDWISCGETAIYVQATLLPSTNYTWIITTPQGAKYLGTTTTDADGFFVIPVSELPDGLFNPYAGIFTLEVQTGTCAPATWNDSAYCEPYTCIEFEAKNGNAGKNVIGCPCLEDIEGCCFPTVVEFTDVATLDIPYTAQMTLKYGDVPTVQTWIYDGLGRLVIMGIFASLDAVPPTLISLDFGGLATGIIVIK